MRTGNNHFKWALSFLLCLGLMDTQYSQAQTPVANPSGTNIALSSSDVTAIGRSGGQTITYSNTSWPGCTAWGLPTSGLNLVSANVLASNSCSYDALNYSSASPTNLAGGVAVWTGTTNYRATTGGNPYQDYSASTRLIVTVTDGNGNPLALKDSSNLIFLRLQAGSNFTFKVNIELQATRPSGPMYNSGGVCTAAVGGWAPAIDLYDCLHTDPTYEICSQFPSTANDYVFYEGFTNSSTTWTGAISTDWFVNTNWTDCVPTSTTDAIVPNTTNKPTIATSLTGNCKTIEIQSSNGALVNVIGNLNVAQ